MIYRVVLFLAALLAGFTASGAEVTLTQAGTLSSLIGTDAATVKELRVTGPIDVRDLEFIASSMPALVSLDLSGADIRNLEGHPAAMTGQTSFRSHVLPPMSLCGLGVETLKLPVSLREIGQGALSATGVKRLEVPSGVTSIGAGAFAACGNLEEITVPSTVTSLGAGAFKGCAKLKRATLRIDAVPAHCFADCAALESVDLGAVTSIGEQAFADCTRLGEVIMDATVLNRIGAEAFRATALRGLDLQASPGISQIGAWAFADNYDLERLLLPMNVLAIGRGYCFGNSELSEFSAPEMPNVVPVGAYKDCSKINYYRMLGQAAERVERHALSGMTSLKRLHLPSTLTELEDYSLAGLTSLERMNAPALMSVPTLGRNVWGDIDRSKDTLGVHLNMIDVFKNAPVWQDFIIVEAAKENTPVIGIDNVMADADGKAKLVCRLNGEELRVSATDGRELGYVRVYDLQGRLLSVVDAGIATEATVDMSGWPNVKLLLVTAGGLSDLGARR